MCARAENNAARPRASVEPGMPDAIAPSLDSGERSPNLAPNYSYRSRKRSVAADPKSNEDEASPEYGSYPAARLNGSSYSMVAHVIEVREADDEWPAGTVRYPDIRSTAASNRAHSAGAKAEASRAERRRERRS